MTVDFDKIKDAVDTIELSSSERENIINSCKDKKRKFNFKPVAGIAAAAAVIVVILASPAFLFKASSPNESADMLMDNISSDFDLYYTADDAAGAQQYECNSSSTATADLPLFEADGFAEIYSIIPYEFSSLVNAEEYQNWSSLVSAENGMAIVQFVKYFDIEKDTFDATNSEYSKRSSSDIGFDSDIIYTFDRKLIDSFYKK